MKKTVVSAMIAASILISSTVNSIGNKTDLFKDVSENDWYYTSVEQLYNNNILPSGDMFYG